MGELGLMPDQFWSLSPREFGLKYRAFLRAENRALYLVGRLAILTTEYKKAPRSVEHLLGVRPPMIRYPIQKVRG